MMYAVVEMVWNHHYFRKKIEIILNALHAYEFYELHFWNRKHTADGITKLKLFTFEAGFQKNVESHHEKNSSPGP